MVTVLSMQSTPAIEQVSPEQRPSLLESTLQYMFASQFAMRPWPLPHAHGNAFNTERSRLGQTLLDEAEHSPISAAQNGFETSHTPKNPQAQILLCIESSSFASDPSTLVQEGFLVVEQRFEREAEQYCSSLQTLGMRAFEFSIVGIWQVHFGLGTAPFWLRQ
jgi:hypothetical protein